MREGQSCRSELIRFQIFELPDVLNTCRDCTWLYKAKTLWCYVERRKGSIVVGSINQSKSQLNRLNFKLLEQRCYVSDTGKIIQTVRQE
jgi:hypothetical protein